MRLYLVARDMDEMHPGGWKTLNEEGRAPRIDERIDKSPSRSPRLTLKLVIGFYLLGINESPVANSLC